MKPVLMVQSCDKCISLVLTLENTDTHKRLILVVLLNLVAEFDRIYWKVFDSVLLKVAQSVASN